MDCTGLLLVLACAIYSVSSQLAVKTGEDALVSVGDTGVELTCTVTRLNLLAQSTQWFKRDLKNKDNLIPISAHNQILADKIQYQIKVSQVPPTDVLFTLTLTEIHSEDDGVYICAVVDTLRPLERLVESSQELKVRQPITSVVLNAGADQVSASDQPNKITVELEKFNPDLVLGCKVQGSNPEPRIELTVGGEIIHKFLRQDQVNVNGRNQKYYRTYDTDIDTTGKRSFDDTIIGKEITCSAWMEDGEPGAANPMTATIVITLKEPPKVDCPEVTTRTGDRRVTMTCTIESQVKPENIKWHIGNNPNQLIIPTTGTYLDEYIANTNDLGSNKYEVTLEIGLIEPKHFDNIYTLQAKVAGGDMTQVARLLQSMPETTTGKSSNDVGLVSVTVTFVMSTMLFGCLLRRWI